MHTLIFKSSHEVDIIYFYFYKGETEAQSEEVTFSDYTNGKARLELEPAQLCS